MVLGELFIGMKARDLSSFFGQFKVYINFSTVKGAGDENYFIYFPLFSDLENAMKYVTIV